MAEKSFNQVFKGYILESGLDRISSSSGIYGVYRCTYDKIKDIVSIKQLIYIGKADDLNNRLNNHEKLNDWKNYLQRGEILCICYSLVSKDYNERVEAALINNNQPIENIEYKTSFPFDKTNITLSGRHYGMNTNTSVSRK